MSLGGPMRVLIVPDKFKGTLSAEAVAQAIARGWRTSRPRDTLELLPMSDGGDGFGQVVAGLCGADELEFQTIDAARRPRLAPWWLRRSDRLAIIDTAAVIGLALLPPGRYHPFQLDTYGLGALLSRAASLGAAKCIVGLGGSATNDGGFGLARSLGWVFEDKAGHHLENWTDLCRLARIRPPRKRRWFRQLTVAVDVNNPLLGSKGATRVYGQQKGLAAEESPAAENALRCLSNRFKQQVGIDLSKQAGAGAAGGLGFGFAAFAAANLVPGFELFAKLSRLEQRIARADLVITGEGRIDGSTFMGKGVGQVGHLCTLQRVPCIGFSGTQPPKPQCNSPFTGLHALTDLVSQTGAMEQPAVWLEKLANRVASLQYLN